MLLKRLCPPPEKTSTPFVVSRSNTADRRAKVNAASSTPAFHQSTSRSVSHSLSPYAAVSPIVCVELDELSMPKEIDSMFEESHVEGDFSIVGNRSYCTRSRGTGDDSLKQVVSGSVERYGDVALIDTSSRTRRTNVRNIEKNARVGSQRKVAESESHVDSGFARNDSDSEITSHSTGNNHSSLNDARKLLISDSLLCDKSQEKLSTNTTRNTSAAKDLGADRSLGKTVKSDECLVISVKKGDIDPKLFNSSHGRYVKKCSQLVGKISDVEPSDTSGDDIPADGGVDADRSHGRILARRTRGDASSQAGMKSDSLARSRDSGRDSTRSQDGIKSQGDTCMKQSNDKNNQLRDVVGGTGDGCSLSEVERMVKGRKRQVDSDVTEEYNVITSNTLTDVTNTQTRAALVTKESRGQRSRSQAKMEKQDPKRKPHGVKRHAVAIDNKPVAMDIGLHQDAETVSSVADVNKQYSYGGSAFLESLKPVKKPRVKKEKTSAVEREANNKKYQQRLEELDEIANSYELLIE